MKTVTIRLKTTGQLMTVKSSPWGWINAKGEFIHCSAADLVNTRAD